MSGTVSSEPGDYVGAKTRALEASVIVPTRDRANLLEHTLNSLTSQDFPSDLYEIIVVDDGSHTPLEPVVDRVRQRRAVRILTARHDRPLGPNAARNTGVAAARSNLLCFVDDDIDAPAAWLANVVAGATRHPGTGCFAGPIRLRVEAPHAADGGIPGDTEVDLGEAEGPIDGCAAGANMIVRRAALDLAGPFDPDLPQYFEEVEWQHRLRSVGGTISYLPEAWLWHRRTREDLRFRRRVRRSFRRGCGEARHLVDQGASLMIARRLSGIPGLLLYSARTRTAHGVMAVVGQAGFLWWLVTHSDRRGETASRP